MRKISAGFHTSKVEMRDLFRAWLFISLAFAIVFNGLSLSSGFVVAVLVSAFTVGLGFLLHELAHKVVAQRFGCFAEFRANNRMLWLALIFSLLGFVFAAPGAVMISGMITRRENGLISLAGPVTNLVLASLFFLGGGFFPFPLLWRYGFQINSWLAFFNLIPIWVLDGKKVLAWNKVVYAFSVVIAALFAFVLPSIL